MCQHGVYDKPTLRMMVEGRLYRMRVGCPWRDLPPAFGFWNSVFQKFNRYPDREWEFILERVIIIVERLKDPSLRSGWTGLKYQQVLIIL